MFEGVYLYINFNTNYIQHYEKFMEYYYLVDNSSRIFDIKFKKNLFNKIEYKIELNNYHYLYDKYFQEFVRLDNVKIMMNGKNISVFNHF